MPTHGRGASRTRPGGSAAGDARHAAGVRRAAEQRRQHRRRVRLEGGQRRHAGALARRLQAPTDARRHHAAPRPDVRPVHGRRPAPRAAADLGGRHADLGVPGRSAPGLLRPRSARRRRLRREAGRRRVSAGRSAARCLGARRRRRHPCRRGRRPAHPARAARPQCVLPAAAAERSRAVAHRRARARPLASRLRDRAVQRRRHQPAAAGPARSSMLSALAAALALAVPPPTHDVLPIFLGDRGPVFVVGTRPTHLADRLRVFRSERGIEDQLPRALLDQALNWDLDGSLLETDRARLLVASGKTRLYGIPDSTAGICFFLADTRGYCRGALLHGAYPFVDARYGAVYGLLDDRAAHVDVRFGNTTRRAVVGRNAFYAHGWSVREVVVTERGGARHVYRFYPCEVTDSDDAFPVDRPLDPRPWFCG